jgi:hypothetical protein
MNIAHPENPYAKNFNISANNFFAPKGRLESKSKNLKGNPILSIEPNSADAKTLVLKFIRKNDTKDSKPTKYYMDKFLCYAKHQGYETVQLQDDSMFTKDDCTYRALLFRAFQNKESIYKSYGFVPKGITEEHINGLRSTIFSFKIKDAKNLFDIKHTRTEKFKDLITAIDKGIDTNNFSNWLLSLDCKVMAELLNNIYVLSFEYTKNKINEEEVKKLNDNSKTFLNSIVNYLDAHNFLIRNPTCDDGAKGGGRRSIRLSSRITRSRRIKSRKTRTRRHYS